MMNLLLAETANKGTSIWIYVILIVMVVAMLVLPSVTNRRRMKEYNQMLDQLRVGDEVRTIGGIIGRVTKINTKGEVKTFVMETGAKGSKTTMEFDMAAVGTVLKSTYVPPVEEKKEEPKVEETSDSEEVKKETETQVEPETKKEIKTEEVKEEKPVQKKSETKKTATKKATAKKTTKNSK